MRLWSLHPEYLDAKGLVAAWREALLAQKVLEGATRGYTNHPQLLRFRETSAPLAVLARFLCALADEADSRGYRFDRSKIHTAPAQGYITVAEGQIAYESALLTAKLAIRDPSRLESPVWRSVRFSSDTAIRLNPVFRAVPGGIAVWEKVRSDIGFLPQR